MAKNTEIEPAKKPDWERSLIDEGMTDVQIVERLASIGAEITDIAYVFGMKYKDALAEYQDAWERGRAQLRTRLKWAQFQKAWEGNPQMLIWLGKQYLGQTDRVEVNSGEEGDTIEVSIGTATAIQRDDSGADEGDDE